MSTDGVTNVGDDTKLGKLIETASGGKWFLECAVLNFCRSKSLAELLVAKGCEHVVYWKGDTTDKACCLFTEGFWCSRASGGSYREAFGCGELSVMMSEQSVFIVDSSNRVRCEAAESTWDLGDSPQFLEKPSAKAEE